MACDVCGYPETNGICSRCGTDLRALAGEDGDIRLEISAVSAPGSGRTRRD